MENTNESWASVSNSYTMSTTTTETKTVKEKTLKWTTCAVPPTNFQLPKDFKLPPGLEAVPVSQDSPTEVPQATSRDYSNVRFGFPNLNTNISFLTRLPSTNTSTSCLTILSLPNRLSPLMIMSTPDQEPTRPRNPYSPPSHKNET